MKLTDNVIKELNLSQEQVNVLNMIIEDTIEAKANSMINDRAIQNEWEAYATEEDRMYGDFNDEMSSSSQSATFNEAGEPLYYD